MSAEEPTDRPSTGDGAKGQGSGRRTANGTGATAAAAAGASAGGPDAAPSTTGGADAGAESAAAKPAGRPRARTAPRLRKRVPAKPASAAAAAPGEPRELGEPDVPVTKTDAEPKPEPRSKPESEPKPTAEPEAGSKSEPETKTEPGAKVAGDAETAPVARTDTLVDATAVQPPLAPERPSRLRRLLPWRRGAGTPPPDTAGTDTAGTDTAKTDEAGADDDPWQKFAPVPERAPGRVRRAVDAVGRALIHEWTVVAVASVLLAVAMTWPTLRYPQYTIPQDMCLRVSPRWNAARCGIRRKPRAPSRSSWWRSRWRPRSGWACRSKRPPATW
jgi:hypothetical protein